MNRSGKWMMATCSVITVAAALGLAQPASQASEALVSSATMGPEFFDGCGKLRLNPHACPVLQADDGNDYFIEDTGTFSDGDYVHVAGTVVEDSDLCPPFNGLAIVGNTISACE